MWLTPVIQDARHEGFHLLQCSRLSRDLLQQEVVNFTIAGPSAVTGKGWNGKHRESPKPFSKHIMSFPAAYPLRLLLLSGLGLPDIQTLFACVQPCILRTHPIRLPTSSSSPKALSSNTNGREQSFLRSCMETTGGRRRTMPKRLRVQARKERRRSRLERDLCTSRSTQWRRRSFLLLHGGKITPA